jgi:hypothetical protein
MSTLETRDRQPPNPTRLESAPFDHPDSRRPYIPRSLKHEKHRALNSAPRHDSALRPVAVHCSCTWIAGLAHSDAQYLPPRPGQRGLPRATRARLSRRSQASSAHRPGCTGSRSGPPCPAAARTAPLSHTSAHHATKSIIAYAPGPIRPHPDPRGLSQEGEWTLRGVARQSSRPPRACPTSPPVPPASSRRAKYRPPHPGASRATVGDGEV